MLGQAGALRRGKAEHRDQAGEAREPEAARGPLACPEDRRHGRGRRQDADDDGAVRGRDVLQRDGGEEGPSEYDAERDDPQAPQLRARRKRRPRHEQDQPGEQRGEGLSPDAHEGRVELLDRHASGGQREAEGEHAEEAEEQRHRR